MALVNASRSAAVTLGKGKAMKYPLMAVAGWLGRRVVGMLFHAPPYFQESCVAPKTC